MLLGVRARLGILLVATALAVTATVVPAGARAPFDRHFDVLGTGIGGRETSNGFAFRFVLQNPANPINQVGHGHARCRFDRGPKPRCRFLFHFDGSIGGFGDLLARGNFGHGDHTFTIVDGDGDFSGRIAGKVTDHTLDRNTDSLHFDLTR